MSDVFQVTERNPFISGPSDKTSEEHLVRMHGTDSQRERYAEWLLPDDELCALARSVLFEPFDFHRWTKIAYFNLKHGPGCPQTGSVNFGTRAADGLTSGEWAVCKRIRDVTQRDLFAQYGAEATLDLVEHVGVCEKCQRETTGRSASVRIKWAGRQFSREYRLEES